MYQEQQIYRPITVMTLAKIKRAGEKFAVLTAYNAGLRRRWKQGVKVILVGNSPGIMIQGQRTTVLVILEHMIYHTRLGVSQDCSTSLLMTDMPSPAYTTMDQINTRR
jgi:3-methyl-2-oxobutanoate hydroxymethyltransferase